MTEPTYITSEEFADCIIAALSENPEQLKAAFFVVSNIKAAGQIELQATEDMESATLAMVNMARHLHDRLRAIVPIEEMEEITMVLGQLIFNV
jgi:hypothetical protein